MKHRACNVQEQRNLQNAIAKANRAATATQQQQLHHAATKMRDQLTSLSVRRVQKLPPLCEHFETQRRRHDLLQLEHQQSVTVCAQAEKFLTQARQQRQQTVQDDYQQYLHDKKSLVGRRTWLVDQGKRQQLMPASTANRAALMQIWQFIDEIDGVLHEKHPAPTQCQLTCPRKWWQLN